MSWSRFNSGVLVADTAPGTAPWSWAVLGLGALSLLWGSGALGTACPVLSATWSLVCRTELTDTFPG
ncbi:hypothetical protein FJTKL_15491 [Diaporthe vaccinii]|uniref:Uncharacterized protein n=1 Tax=Diaporthe vaccinii TaxID=105482 RepID=A0ABR4F6M4_9PEZI